MIQASPDLEEVRRIVLHFLQGREARVYLFGSWARGEADRALDIDVGILSRESLPMWLLAEMEEALESSRSLYPVDLFDLRTASKAFCARVIAEGVLWNG